MMKKIYFKPKTKIVKKMTTTKKEERNSSTAGVDYEVNFVEKTEQDKESCAFKWDGTVYYGEKQKLAADVMMRVLDFNLRELSRTDVDTVQVFENPAKYAADLVNELFDSIK